MNKNIWDICTFISKLENLILPPSLGSNQREAEIDLEIAYVFLEPTMQVELH